MAKQSYWFKHDYNSRSDGRLISLQMSLGMEGVGIYWCIVEMLYEEGGYLLRSECERIAFELRTHSDKVTKVVESNLFECENGKFWSESVLRRLGKSKEKSKKNSNNAQKRWDDERKKKEEEANAMRTHSDGNADGMLRREDKKREDILTSNYNPPVLAQTQNLPLVHEMIRVWKKYTPDYFEDTDNDSNACLKIAYNIAKEKNWKKDEVVSARKAETIESWDRYAKYISNHPHYSRLALVLIIKHWASLLLDIKAEKKKREDAVVQSTATVSASLPPKYMTDEDRNKYRKKPNHVQTASAL